MLDTRQVSATIQAVIAKYPVVEPYLRRIAERVAARGARHGRMKLGVRLPQEVINGLLRLLPNAALDIRPDGTTYVRLDRVIATAEDAAAWVAALSTVFEIPDGAGAFSRRQTAADAAQLLERCRLAFPDLLPIWDTEQPADIASMVTARPATVVQQEYFRLAAAVSFLLSDHEPLGMADFSARCFADSKVLKTTPSLVRRLADWLLLLRDAESTDEARRLVWAAYGVVENFTAIKATLFGPLEYVKHGERFDWIAQLHARGETATLSWDNLRGIDALVLPAETPVITCENETPFNALIREGLPALCIYTAGYPNMVITRLLHLLPAETSIQHWGDTDLDGLRIAAMLHQIRSVRLWRCDLAEVQRHRSVLLPLLPDRLRKAEAFRENHPDFPFLDELAFTIAYGWLEQERWSKR